MGREIPVELNNEPWTVRYVSKIRSRRGNPLTDLGHCVYRTKTIWIRSHQSKEDEVDTVIHEGIHAELPNLHEDVVARVATSLKNLLKACGLI